MNSWHSVGLDFSGPRIAADLDGAGGANQKWTLS